MHSISATSITTSDEQGTAAVGKALAASLEGGDVVLLTGDLGAGKTAFVRGLAEGLGIDPDVVSSPTFTLIQEYRGGRVLLAHADLYRVTSAREIEELGLEEYRDAIVAIEWAERLSDEPPGTVRVDIAHTGETARTVTISPGQPRQLRTAPSGSGTPGTRDYSER